MSTNVKKEVVTPSKVKREPLSTLSSSEDPTRTNVNNNSKPLQWTKVKQEVRSESEPEQEPAEEVEEDDDCDEIHDLPVAAERNYKRIRRLNSSSSEDDGYVPLIPDSQRKSISKASQEVSSSSSSPEPEPQPSTSCTSSRKRKLPTRNTRSSDILKTKHSKNNISQSNQLPKTKKTQSRSRRVNEQEDESDSFIVPDDEEVSEEEDVASTPASTSSDDDDDDQAKNKSRPIKLRPRSKGNTAKPKRIVRRKSTDEESGSGDSRSDRRKSDSSARKSTESNDSLFEAVQGIRKKKKRRPSQLGDGSSSEEIVIVSERTPIKKTKASSSTTNKECLASNKKSSNESEDDGSVSPPKRTYSHKNHQRSSSSSSASDSDDKHIKKRKTKRQKSFAKRQDDPLVQRSVKSFVDTTGGGARKQISYSSRQARCSLDFVQNPPEHYNKMDTDDDFIDDNTTNYGNLESSSSSDNSEVAEDPNALDLDSDNYEKGPSTDDDDDDSDDGRSDTSQSDSDYEDLIRPGRAHNRVDDLIPGKCLLCEHLENNSFKNRDRQDSEKKWCKCKCCDLISSKMENYDRICCQEIKKVRDKLLNNGKNVQCITQDPQFKTNVMDYKAHLESRSATMSNKFFKVQWTDFKKSTDKEKIEKSKDAFLQWIFGRTGLKNQMVVPACVVRLLMNKYAPTAGNLFFESLRFIPKKLCESQNHCKKAWNVV